jgi:hypothetical protein
MASGIDIGYAVPEPTVCGPVSHFKDLTLSSNCIAMGGYGAIAGFLATLMMVIGYFWAGPRLVAYGRVRGWWS